MLRKGHGGLCKSSTWEERRQKAKRRERERDRINFTDLRIERWQVVGLTESCQGKAVVAYTKPQQRKKKERSERLRGERAIRSSLLILDLKDSKL